MSPPSVITVPVKPSSSAPVVEWFSQAVQHAVCVDFDRYIEAGDLQKAKDRIAKLQAQSDEQGGFLGMYL